MKRKPTSQLTTGNRKSFDHCKYLRMTDDQFNIRKTWKTRELMGEEEWKEFCQTRKKQQRL